MRRNKVPDTSKSGLVEQTMVLRRSSAGRRRGKQHMSPEKSDAPVVKEKEVKASGGLEGAEISALAKLKGGAVDAVDGSSSLVVESSRDSRRLMQGARQVCQIFFKYNPIVIGDVPVVSDELFLYIKHLTRYESHLLKWDSRGDRENFVFKV